MIATLLATHRLWPRACRRFDILFAGDHFIGDGHAKRMLDTRLGAAFTLSLPFVLGIISVQTFGANNLLVRDGLVPAKALQMRGQSALAAELQKARRRKPVEPPADLEARRSAIRRDMLDALEQLKAGTPLPTGQPQARPPALLVREDDPDDGRAQTLALTAAGRALVPQLARLADENDDAFFAPLSAAERGVLEGLLRRLAQSGGMSRPPTD